MKPFITAVATGLLLMSFGLQSQRDIITSQFQRLVGEWEGLMEYTSYEDNISKQVTPAKCESKTDGKAWLYKVTYDEGNGQIFEGEGECLVSQDGSQMMYNGIKWDVKNVEESADTVRIMMETKGKDNKKKATLRQTMEVTDKTFTLTEEVKYDAGGDYFVRNKHLFRKRR
jgi:hypothetical protein